MNRKLRTLNQLGFLMIATATLSFAQLASASQEVSIRLLGGVDTFATSINDRGQVVGFSPGHLAFLWQDGTTTNLLPVDPYGFNGVAVAINNSGQVAGYYSGPGHPYDSPFLWQDGVLTDLGVLPGTAQCYAGESNIRQSPPARRQILNNRGQVVGTCDTFGPLGDLGGPTTEFLWQDGVLTDLGIPGNRATAINDRGQVVGGGFLWQDGMTTPTGLDAVANNDRGQVVGNVYEANPDPDSGGCSLAHAVIRQHGVRTNLGALPGDEYSAAVAINARGQAIGYSYSTFPHTCDPIHRHAFLWQNGVMTDLGTLGGASAFPTAINNRGQVVGSSDTLNGGQAFLWQDSVMTDLGTLPGGTGSNATGINNRGQVIGYSNSTATGQFYAVLWEIRGGRHGGHGDRGDHHHGDDDRDVGQAEQPAASTQE